MIRYVSTRGSAPALSFEDVVLAGLASDGGLYVPDHIPVLNAQEIAALKMLPYNELAYAIISRFVDDTIEKAALRNIIDESYKTFRHADVAPLTKIDDSTYILELFHGPTLAFKDFALQFLGRLLDHILSKKNEKVVVIGATSGDTGSAAIAGCRGRNNMEIFILHPHERVSNVQRRQMTTVEDANVHNIAIKGAFDDCQDIVKALFNDAPFREKHHLTAVNSINWARILAQVVYYFYAALKLGAPEKKVSFCVPTGNFGDIYAGYIAKRMGLPVEQLIIATNRNDILARTLETGTYGMEGVTPTISPSMDIQISSNFERLMFDLYNRDGKAIADIMKNFRADKKFTLTPDALAKLRADFSAASVNDADTKKTIAEVQKTHAQLLDPHTAVGFAAARRARKGHTPMIVLSTAHPAKFPDAVKEASGITPELPPHMQDLFKKQERFDVLDNAVAQVKDLIEKRA